MKWTTLMLAALGTLIGTVDKTAAELALWRLGGRTGDDWEQRTALNLVVDMASVPGSLQPMELEPGVNVVPRLGPWVRQRDPAELFYRTGLPRIWYGVGNLPQVGHGTDPLAFIDGDLDSYYADSGFRGGGPGRGWGEYYTLDLG